MEKHTPHCKLQVVRMLLETGRFRATGSALHGAASLGLDLNGMVDIIQALTPMDFHKSMTTSQDHRIWQDVYRPRTPLGDIYLKLTVIDDVLIVSFKEL